MELVEPPEPQLTEKTTVPIMISSNTNFVRRLLPATAIPRIPSGNTEARIGDRPNLSWAVLGLIPLPLPAIVSVTVAVGTDVPSIFKEVGDAAQVAPLGAVHVRFNVWLNPLSGVALTWKVTVPPAEDALIDDWELVSVKSGAPEDPADVPVPVRAIDCGEFAAMPVIVRLEVELAVAVGAKVT